MSTTKIVSAYKTKLDLMNSRIFGFKRANLLHKLYDPLNVKYIRSPSLGIFRTPANPRNREIRSLVFNWSQAQAYANHFSYKGYLPTITSNFPKPSNKSTDFAECKVIAIKSGKVLEKNQLKFLVDMKLTKPEIVQIIQKFYKIKVLRITTAILPGQIKMNNFKLNGEKVYYRTPDKKVATITIDFKVNSNENMLITNKNKHLFNSLNNYERKTKLYYDQKKNCMKMVGATNGNLSNYKKEKEKKEEKEKNVEYQKRNESLISSIIPNNRKLILEFNKIKTLDNLSEFFKSKI